MQERALTALRIAEMTLSATASQLDEFLCDSAVTNQDCALARLTYIAARINHAKAYQAWVAICAD